MGASTTYGNEAGTERRAAAAAASDRALVQRVQLGDLGAFAAIYDRYRAPLLSFCRHMLATRAAGERATLQTFVAAQRGLLAAGQQATSGGLELRGWLFTLARERCLELARRPDSTQPLGARSAAPDTGGLLESVARREDLRRLLTGIHALPGDQRAALILFELGGLSQRGLAAALGRAPAGVTALVHEARTALMSDRPPPPSACQAVQQQLSNTRGEQHAPAYLRGHATACSACRAFAAELRRQREALLLILPVTPGASLRPALLAAVGGPGAKARAGASEAQPAAATTSGARRRRRRYPALALLGVAAALTAGAVLLARATQSAGPGSGNHRGLIALTPGGGPLRLLAYVGAAPHVREIPGGRPAAYRRHGADVHRTAAAPRTQTIARAASITGSIAGAAASPRPRAPASHRHARHGHARHGRARSAAHTHPAARQRQRAEARRHGRGIRAATPRPHARSHARTRRRVHSP